jgi:hypothetical protein
MLRSRRVRLGKLFWSFWPDMPTRLSRLTIDWGVGHSLRVATAEGLILTKLIAFRDQDQADIVTLLAACHGAL